MTVRLSLFLTCFSLLFGVSAGGAAEIQRAAAAQEFDQRLASASLPEQRLMLREWSVNAILPELANAAAMADEKFLGVRSMGRLILQTDFSQPVDVGRLAYHNPDYWRGMVEMAHGNHLIAALPPFVHLANGEWDLAYREFEVLQAFSDKTSLAALFVGEARNHLEICRHTLVGEIRRGIALHDAGKFSEAAAVYQAVLATGVQSAWARYELFFSNSSGGGKMRFVQALADAGPDGWPAAAKEIYKMDPLYTTQPTGKRGKDMAALMDRMALKALWTDKALTSEQKFANFADLALKLESYPMSAHLYWFIMSVKGSGVSIDESILRFLYSLDKLGVPQLEKEFKGKFPKKFKALDKELAKHRTS